METKVLSYRELKIEGKKISERMYIFDILQHYDSLSRKEISVISELPINVVCGRVSELLERGEVETKGFQIDAHSKRKVELIGVVNII